MLSAAEPGERTAVAWRVVLVLLATGQVVSPIVVSVLGGGQFTTSDRVGEPPIVPAGYAFSIWGLVEALCLAYAIWALVTRAPGHALRDRLARPLCLVFTGFTVWLIAAEVEPVWSTVAVFVVMVIGLLKAMDIAVRHRAEIARWHTAPRVLLWSMLGVYTGWSSVAIWVNLTTALIESGAPTDGPAGVAGQIAILAGATATAVALLWRIGGLVSYGLSVAWAIVAVVIATADARQFVLSVIAAVALLLVVVATVWFRLRAPGAA
ncbi:hypothetical protein DFR72_111266 [Lentzea flaviverrucosa]|uniref:TspO and MBR related proteins n=1 Tax=Lentzea flaviverrucosa TaxID=200379 RepID=A0A1H9WVE4_9PSEU|nr:hypothetical protein DFR72_111266 [Lentzea flaviverrucosa]SES37805.1 hypothetical protein SAMN05216195_112260 [Lentzea flaviverrucosa]